MREQTINFVSGDGVPLTLVNVRQQREPVRGPVLLVHGAGVRGNIFRAPVKRTLVDELVDAGYDVWLENWRASIDLPPSEWTLDEAALYDHPKAVEVVAKATGARTIKAIIHCQGSTSFAMSAVAGLVPQVDTIVSNAVTLHPVVPSWSRFKLRFAVPLVSIMTRYLNPRWGREAPTLAAKLITALVKATHHECKNTVCKLVSFTYGAGFPALWLHENIDANTHDDFIPAEFGAVPLTFFKQMSRCVKRGALVCNSTDSALPECFTDSAPRTQARWALLAGEKNLCFLPESQRRTHRYLDSFRPGYHTLHIIPGYSHLDIFMGTRAAQDVFPIIMTELERGARSELAARTEHEGPACLPLSS